jgi:uncharacterized protein YjbI with pentapeptide repeats
MFSPPKLASKQLTLFFLICVACFETSGQKDPGAHVPLTKSSLHVKHPAAFARKLRDGQDLVSQFLQTQLTAKTKKQLVAYNDRCPLTESLQKDLIEELGAIVSKSSLYDANRFKDVQLSADTQRLLSQDSQAQNPAVMNWSLLADAYPFEITKDPSAGTLDLGYNREDFPPDGICYPKLNGSDIQKLFQNGNVSKRTIPAETLAKALMQRPGPKDKPKDLEITSCYIEGDLDLTNREVFSALLVANTNFGGEILLDGAKVYNTFGFEPATIDYFSAKKTSFRGAFHVNGSTFAHGASFAGAQFLDSADFSNAMFNNDEGVANTFADFAGARFARGVAFDAVRFDTSTSFDNAIFQGGTSFDFAGFLGETTFSKTEFGDVVSFRSVSIVRPMIFTQVVFPASVSFDGFHGNRPLPSESAAENPTPNKPDIPEGAPVPATPMSESEEKQLQRLELSFYGTTFRGVTSFDRLNVTILQFPTVRRGQGAKKQSFSPLVCEKPTSFSSMSVEVADFSHAEFRDHADFTKTTFTKFAKFDNATFRDTASFDEAEFPEPDKAVPRALSGLHLDHARFFKSVNLDWKQLSDGRLVTQDPATWATLEAAFKSSGNLTSQNEAYFNKRELSAQDLGDHFAFILWGYGVRPYRLLAWIVLIQLIFTFLYWTQTRFIIGRADRWSWHKGRLAFALGFGWRTALSWRYGIANSRSSLYKTLTLLHAVIIKVLLVVLFVSIANVSPLLHSIIGKLVPI